MKTRKSLTARVNHVRQLVDSLGPAAAFRKLHGVLNALEMQVEDGNYQRHAVTRLCEALLATAELYRIGEDMGSLVGLWRRPLQVGQPLPSLPLSLSVHQSIVIDLEETYQRAARRAYLD